MTTLFCHVLSKTVYLAQFQLENRRSIESANRELERKTALFKHDLKEVRHFFFLYDHLLWTSGSVDLSFHVNTNSTLFLLPGPETW